MKFKPSIINHLTNSTPMTRASKITQAKTELQPLKEQLDQLWEQYTAALIANTGPDLIQLLALKLQELSSQRKTVMNGITND